MDPSRNKMITAHEDKVFFHEALLFTAGQTGLNANLIEKDYYCTVLLQYLYRQPESLTIRIFARSAKKNWACSA